MATILKGAPVAAAIAQKTSELVCAAKAKGITPTLAILRVGNKDADASYIRGARKRCDEVGIEVAEVTLAEDVLPDDFFAALQELNDSDAVHGILMLRPLPQSIDEKRACEMISPAKDVDGCTEASLAGVFTGSGTGFTPCTAQAAVEILDYYGIDCTGKHAVVLGRSLVVGRPVALLLQHKNATVTMCHSKSEAVELFASKADILVACTGRMESVGAEYASFGQTIIDVGISWNGAKGKLCGDVDFDAVEPLVGAITPVPGGVGAVTNSILGLHVAQAALR